MKNLTIENQISETKEEEIIIFFKEKDIKVPDNYIGLISKYGGARINENYYKDKYCIQNILPLYSKRNASIEKIIETYLEEENTENWLPFAIDPGGWVFVISLYKDTYGQIFIDRFDSGEENPFVFVTDSLDEFINGLHPAE